MGLKAVVGLDIGNATIKVAEVRVSGGRPQVTALGIAPTPPDSVNQSMIVDAEALSAAIKELMVSAGVREKRVVSSVGGQQSLVVRIIEVPKMTEKELAETMKWEVERHVPFASSELQMDYQIIHRPDTPPDAQTMEVLLVVAQQEMINTHVDAVGNSGLDPVAIDVEPLAAARALVDVHGPERQEQTIGIVNVGALFTDVSIVRHGLILFQRTVATAGNTLNQAIAGAVEVSNEVAERIKKTKASVDLEAFSAPPATADIFGGGGDAAAAFGFGVPPAFGAAPEAAATPAPEEPTLFNPFATDASPAAPAAPAAEASPFAAAPQGEELPQWSPFGAPAGGAPEAPAAAPAPAEAASPFGQPGPGADANPFAAAAGGDANPFAAAAEGDANPLAAPAEPAADGAAGADTFDFAATEFAGLGSSESTGAPAEDLTPQQVFDIIRESLTDLVTEVKRSVDYYRGRSSNATIDMILLVGGTARLPQLDKLLEGELGVPVTLANPFQAVPVQSALYPAEYLQEIAPLFAVSVGLGLRETVF